MSNQNSKDLPPRCCILPSCCLRDCFSWHRTQFVTEPDKRAKAISFDCQFSFGIFTLSKGWKQRLREEQTSSLRVMGISSLQPKSRSGYRDTASQSHGKWSVEHRIRLDSRSRMPSDSWPAIWHSFTPSYV